MWVSCGLSNARAERFGPSFSLSARCLGTLEIRVLLVRAKDAFEQLRNTALHTSGPAAYDAGEQCARPLLCNHSVPTWRGIIHTPAHTQSQEALIITAHTQTTHSFAQLVQTLRACPLVQHAPRATTHLGQHLAKRRCAGAQRGSVPPAAESGSNGLYPLPSLPRDSFGRERTDKDARDAKLLGHVVEDDRDDARDACARIIPDRPSGAAMRLSGRRGIGRDHARPIPASIVSPSVTLVPSTAGLTTQ